MPWATVEPVLDSRVRELCRKRYPGHPNGCPNYGTRPSCPPAAPRLYDVLDSCYPMGAIWNAFDFGAHVERMRKRHPDWTERQLANCLYWQGTARKALRVEIGRCRAVLPYASAVVTCPEACGVNVTATMKKLGIELEWPPRTVAYQVALVGTPKG